MTTTKPASEPAIQEQTQVGLAHAAGYVSYRTVAVGLRRGLVEALGEASGGATPDELADRLELDPFYVSVWCRSAFAAGICDRDHGIYRLAAHMATLLLDADSPAYLGGVFTTLEQPEVFDCFEASLASGERSWWDQTSPDWIAAVARAGTPFYTRLIPGGLEQVPGLGERLVAGCRVVDSACGAGVGIVRLAETYPACRVVGVDGDDHSIQQAGHSSQAAHSCQVRRGTCRSLGLGDVEQEQPAGSQGPMPQARQELVAHIAVHTVHHPHRPTVGTQPAPMAR